MDKNFYKKLHSLGLSGPEPKSLEELNIILQLATEEDWKDFRKIRVEAIQTDPLAFNLDNQGKVERQMNKSEAEIKEDLRENIVFLAMNKDVPVGVVKGMPRQEKSWSINNVFVSPEFRKSVSGAPVAEELIKKVLVEIKNRGGDIVRLWVKDGNDNAVSLYMKLGFRKFNPITSPKKSFELTGNRPDLLIGWQIMELDLTSTKDNP